MYVISPQNRRRKAANPRELRQTEIAAERQRLGTGVGCRH
jgi:hypothetical protein